MKTFALVAALLVTPSVANGWDVLQEEHDGGTFAIAEQAGEAGSYLRLVCFENAIHIEMVIPAAIEPIQDAAEIFQVDDNPERIVAGFVDLLDDSTSVFVGLDRRDQPAAATAQLVEEIKKGQELYLGDPDLGEAIERWSLKGSAKAVNAIISQCS